MGRGRGGGRVYTCTCTGFFSFSFVITYCPPINAQLSAMASIEAAINGKKENYVSDSESEGEEGGNGGPSPGPGLPPPINDGLPQVR